MPRLLCLCLLLTAAAAPAETLTIDQVLTHPRETLLRPAVEITAVDRAIVQGTWTGPDDAWTARRAGEDGWIEADPAELGYAYAEIVMEEDSTWLLDAMGYATVDVNGEPRIGNIYGSTDDWEAWQPHFDFSVIPVRLHAGVNTFLFRGNRYGRLRARLTRVEEGLSFNGRDATLPDLVHGRIYDGWGAIVVINATGGTVSDAVLTADVKGGEPRTVPVPPLPPYGVRKVGFRIDSRAQKTATAEVALTLKRGGRTQATHELVLAVKQPHENRRVTFVSEIDRSVQYYGYLPATGGPGPKALVLSLHGASVEAINQSGSYAPLPWAEIVAPTNRRPFGFSWEDWGRRDALEVLDLATETLDIDPDRVYLTGHSMGGHGSWQLAGHYPDRFAAVGPSAGWIDLWSYRQDAPADEPDALTVLVERATLPSRTREFAPNLADMGVYVLHGGADDNVPPEQAYLMLDVLEGFHRDYVFHEEPDVGHWWDRSPDPGADCVSWSPMFDFFARHRLASAEELRRIAFRTASPSISAWNRWVGVLQQIEPWEMSAVDLTRDAAWTHVDGTTRNVRTLALDWSRSEAAEITVTLDGQTLSAPAPDGGTLFLRSRDGEWSVGEAPDPREKGAANNGGFRSAFQRDPQLVYATGGSPAENAWALAQARYDAEWLWYQGNGSVDVLPDTLFDPTAEPERDVVLYGHEHRDRLWLDLMTSGPLIQDDSLTVGLTEIMDPSPAILCVRPRRDSTSASVGIVAAAGEHGRRLLQTRPYLRLGVAYPDVVVFQSFGKPLAAGFWGSDWHIREKDRIRWVR